MQPTHCPTHRQSRPQLVAWMVGMFCLGCLLLAGTTAQAQDQAQDQAQEQSGDSRLDSAQSQPIQTDTTRRPRIGLVLSGGGARGVAHVGVLRALEDMRIPIDAIAGTSMGAVVGGLYASGMSARDIEKLVNSVVWQDAFDDSPPRKALGARRKQDDRNFLVRYSLGVGMDGFKLPTGLVQGQKLTQLLRTATLNVADAPDFDHLPVRFRAVATDLETGTEVVLQKGDLVSAMRASMSAPGVFTPVELNDRLLVDGGLVNNLPIEVARQMNVDVLIVVDVSFPLYARDELTSPLAVTNQAAAIMVRNRTREQRALLNPNDIVIDPALGTLSSADFSRVARAMLAGEVAANGKRMELSALALDTQRYAGYLANREPLMRRTPRIDFIEPDAKSQSYQTALQEVVGDMVGQPLDRAQLNEDLTALYALDRFESIDYQLVSRKDQAHGDQTGLLFHLRRKSWGPNYVRVGINLEDDFEGNSRYNLAARFIMTELNDLGAEWLTDMQIGDAPRIATEWYQPLSWQPRYFVVPHVEYAGRVVPLIQNDKQIARYRVRTLQGELAAGRELSNWGEIRLGLHRGSGSTHVLVGAPGLPEEHYNTGGYFARFAYDTLDSVYFPKHGQQLTVQWDSEKAWLGSDNDASKMAINWQWAFPVGRYTMITSADIGTSLSGQPATHDYFTLGGFLNLSGVTADSLAGPHYGIARMVFYRQIGRGGTGVLELPAYAGVSFEIGNVWNTRQEASLDTVRHNGSLFFGADTPVGPMYLAVGMGDHAKTAFYLFLGRSF